MLKVLIACESSGNTRDAFLKRGFDAMSCDLLPTEKPGPHYEGDVFDLDLSEFDLMIAHPPCTYLCSSGMHYTTRGLRDPQLTEDAAAFFLRLINAPVFHIAVENPVGVMSTRYRKPDQYIQPHEYGHDASKKTGLWLKNLPRLVPDPENYVAPRIVNGKKRWANQTDSGQNRLPPSADRWRIRSQTYPGRSEAMARQWGDYCNI